MNKIVYLHSRRAVMDCDQALRSVTNYPKRARFVTLRLWANPRLGPSLVVPAQRLKLQACDNTKSKKSLPQKVLNNYLAQICGKGFF